jgi:hypothetical protein
MQESHDVHLLTVLFGFPIDRSNGWNKIKYEVEGMLLSILNKGYGRLKQFLQKRDSDHQTFPIRFQNKEDEGSKNEQAHR